MPNSELPFDAELLLYLFGRQSAARVDVLGPPEAVAAVQNTRFGM